MDWLREKTVLCTAAFAVPPVAIYAANWLPAIGFLAALALVVIMARSRGQIPAVPWSALGFLPALLTALVLWAALSAAWALDPAGSLSTAAKVLLIAVAAFLLLRGALALDLVARGNVGMALLLGFLIALALIGFELASDGMVIRLLRGLSPEQRAVDLFARSTSVLALFVWPAGLVIWRKFGWGWALAIYVLTLGIVTQLTSMASVVALACGGAVLLLAVALPRVAGWFLAATIAIMVGVTPLMSVVAPATKTALTEAGMTNFSVMHRLVIWDYVGERVAERPLVGWGMDAARHLGASAEAVEIITLSGFGPLLGKPISLHPHNGFLQIWLELGVPGMLILAALLLLAVRWIMRHIDDRRSLATCLATMAAGLVIMQISYGIWQGWWQSALWLVAGITLAVADRRPIGQVDSSARRYRELPIN
ncbi:MAG: O-antigen ligase family protein [Alphaproteobacteria bacterium]|nr:O-antigen ligase family protein [Alphaproteobacteria bacterium]